MKARSAEQMHAEELRQLTGCRYAVLLRFEQEVARHLRRPGRGAPFLRSARTILVVALSRLRSGLPLRTLVFQWRIPIATLCRYTALVCSILARLPLVFGRKTGKPIWLAVDTTSTRVRSRSLRHYSGYKHHRCCKVQVICCADGIVLAVSPSYPGSIHDKTVWNQEFLSILPLLTADVVADKAYAGAQGEGTVLHRPVKRNERVWQEDEVGARARNRDISRRRVKIENVFATMKTWRAASGPFPFDPSTYGMVMKAIAVICNANLIESRA